jgi:hypothetical protein
MSGDYDAWCERHPKTQCNTAGKCILCLADEFFVPLDTGEPAKVDADALSVGEEREHG